MSLSSDEGFSPSPSVFQISWSCWVLLHPVMALTDDDTLSLLTSDFWIRPVYEELLYAASRFNRSSEAKHKRPTSNLVPQCVVSSALGAHCVAGHTERPTSCGLTILMLQIFFGSDQRFFFYCKAELAIKPCRSSRSNTRGGFEKFHDTCKTLRVRSKKGCPS